MDIRIAVEDDRQAILACVDDAYGMYIDRIGKKPAPMLADYAELISKSLVYVATDKDQIQGLIVLLLKENYLLIENVAVRNLFQGQGIGRRLIEFAFTSAKEAGTQEVRLYTNELMSENLLYYAKLGFIQLNRSTEDGYRRVHMSKSL
ncbi:GNAT family N-acetyltransferase [Trichococcus sp. K1Tr]|uniref:GNAT family N-acetyltransferase n=1 Tax=Trichococcus sp. K1Tr TaxID=3020847 RepID=UPI00232C0A17|nr:GNAT family N-acetyltransferase [Trichococcus sp. K1Tr]MDB6353667.1 GNAT family N-acetyltransferase [Trichococcus sp. K1Tr]